MPFQMRVEIERGGDVTFDATNAVKVGDRLIPRRAELNWPAADGWPALQLVVEVRNGVPVCTQVNFVADESNGEVRAKHLRGIALEDWVEMIVGLTATRIVDEQGGYYTAVSEAGEKAAREAIQVVRNARRAARRQVTDELLREVATIYRANVSDRPTDHVMSALGCSYRTAARYVQLARQSKHLPATTQGKSRA